MDNLTSLKQIRLSISTKLLVSLILILLPIVVVFAASLNLLFIAQSAKKTLTDVTLPFLTNSQVLSKSVSDYLLTIERIPEGISREATEERLKALQARIDRSLTAIEEKFPDQRKSEKLQEMLGHIDRRTEALKRFYLDERPEKLLGLLKQQTNLSETVDALRGAVRRSQVREALSNGDASSVSSSLRLLVDIQLLSAVLERYNSDLSSNQVRALQNEFSMLVRKAVSDLTRIEDFELRQQASVQLEPLVQNVGGNGSFFATAVALAAGQEEALQIAADVRSLENDIVGEIADLVETSNASASNEFSDLGELISNNIVFLIGIMIAALVAAMLIIFFFVRPNIIHRLTRLAASTQKIAEGDHEAPVDTTGTDEISQMASATEIFRKALIDREKLVDDLTDSNERLTRFAYVCSHDLREPVRMIRAFTDRLRSHLDQNPQLSDEKVERYIDQLHKASKRGQSLIDDILAYSRLDQDVKLLEIVDIRSLLSEISENFDLADPDEEKRIRFGDMPDVRGNKTQLYQLFQNLVSNGLKYNLNNEEAEVRISSRQLPDGMVEFVVADNGIGIAENHQSQVFEVFRRLHRNDEYSGTGVGLAICKKIVELHSGKIWLKSATGKGTKFFVTLPAASASTT